MNHSHVRTNVLGFLISIVLTLLAFYLASFKGVGFDCAVAGLGVAQAAVILLLFFNIFEETKPRWNLIVFLFMVMVVLIVVLGSIWIMDNLNYNLMT